MKFTITRILFVLSAVLLAVSSSRASLAPVLNRSDATFRFEPNGGQVSGDTAFFAIGGDASVFLTREEAVVYVSRQAEEDSPGVARAAAQPARESEEAVLRIRPERASAGSRIVGLDPLPGKTHYFFGNDPEKWVTNVTGYRRVKYENVYPGIDLVYYGNQEGRLEYDFVVHPGADPGLISVNITGGENMEVDSSGHLLIQTALGEVRQEVPRVYQSRLGFEQEVVASYALLDEDSIAFKLGEYDATRDLIIDPQLVFATLLGGGGLELLSNVAVDAAGNIYAGGHTTALDFPIAGGALQRNKTSSNRSAWVSKLNATGTQLIYSTYLGGSGDDPAFRLTVDSAGNAYISGATNSSNFPSRNEFQGAGGSYDAFLAKLNPSGDTLLYSTTIGGSGFDNSQGVAVDNIGNAWVSGMTASDNFPTRNPTQATRGGAFDSFLTLIDTKQGGSASVVFSTFYGGNGDDNGSGTIVDGAVAVDASGNSYITGATQSTNLPTVNPFQAAYGGSTDYFVVKRNPAGAIIYATYLGGSAVDASFGIFADNSGSAYVVGVTLSTNYPTRNPYQASIRGGADGALAKFDPAGALMFSTYIGGTSDESAQRVTADTAGNVFLGGNTSSSNFPVTDDRLQAYGGGSGDGWVAQISPAGNTLVYSTFIGGSGGEVTLGVAIDAQGNIYAGGNADSVLFPTTSGVIQPGIRGGQDAFLLRLSPTARTSIAFTVPGGGAAIGSSLGTAATVRAGYAVGSVTAGPVPYGTAVFGLTQNGVVVSEAGVPASTPTTSARIFVDFRTGVTTGGSGPVNINTGLALANMSASPATVTATLRDLSGQTVASGSGTIPGNAHRSQFIDQLGQLTPGFVLPANFSTVTRFGTLEISSTQALSIVALRLTVNQRGETLLTSTPIADLTLPQVTTNAYFPQLVDGGGYNTSIILLNTANSVETGSLRLFDNSGAPMLVRATGVEPGSTIPYNIPVGGAFVFETDGSPVAANVGWVQLVPSSGPTPVGAGVFRLSQGGVVVTESGVPAVTPTTRARIYVDKSSGHDTGLAIGNPGTSVQSLTLTAYQLDGTSLIGWGAALVNPNGHAAQFAAQFVPSIPAGFTGVLEISSPTPFVALTLRSLTNARGEFLLTAFPIADLTQPAPPAIFPQIADGNGYVTQFILLSPSSAVGATLRFFDSNGAPLAVGR